MNITRYNIGDTVYFMARDYVTWHENRQNYCKG